MKTVGYAIHLYASKSIGILLGRYTAADDATNHGFLDFLVMRMWIKTMLFHEEYTQMSVKCQN